MTSAWRPFYLRPIILLCYGIILALLIALLEILLAVSEKGQGLATGHNEFRYLWTYGPTAFLTLLTAIWSRVTFQAQSVTPWFRISNRTRSDMKNALLLDYTSMFQPVAIFKSLRNRDWAVGVTIIGLLVSQLAVALSTGLFQIDWENVNLESIPITLETAFSNDSRTVEPLSTLDHYATLETFDGSAQYRRGTTGGFAYQTFDSQLNEIAELRTTVDGFTADMACEPASLSVTNIDYKGNFANFSAAIESYQCHLGWNISLNLFPDNVVASGGIEYPGGTSEKYISRLISGKCDSGSDLESNRMALVFGVVKYSYGPFGWSAKSYNFSLLSVEMETSAQIFCKPTYQIARLDLAQNGTGEPFVTQLDNSTTLPYIRPWDIIEAMLATQNLLIPDVVTPAKQLFPDADADVDNFTANLLQASGTPSPQSLVMPQFLIAILSRYCRVFAAQIASLSLMHPTSEPSTASAKIRRYRLTVNDAVCQELAALLSLLLISCIVTLTLQWKKSSLSQRTSHIIGVAEACASNTAIMDTICWPKSSGHEGLQDSDIEMDSLSFEDDTETAQLHIKDETLEKDQKLDIGTIIPQQYFNAPGTSPSVIRIWVVMLMIVFLIAIIAALETSLQMSQKNQGYCKVDDDPYVRYGITIIPALVLGLVAIYFGSVDYESRTLTPYWLMAGRAGSTKSLYLDLLNSATPRIIWSEIRSRSYVSLAVTVATLIASLFTTFTSPLFSGVVMSQMSGIQLQTNETLRTTPQGQSLNGPDKIRSSLILRANWTYPRNTYEDLAFVGTTIKESNATRQFNITLQSNSTLESNSTLQKLNDTEALIHCTASTSQLPVSEFSRPPDRRVV